MMELTGQRGIFTAAVKIQTDPGIQTTYCFTLKMLYAFEERINILF